MFVHRIGPQAAEPRAERGARRIAMRARRAAEAEARAMRAEGRAERRRRRSASAQLLARRTCLIAASLPG